MPATQAITYSNQLKLFLNLCEYVQENIPFSENILHIFNNFTYFNFVLNQVLFKTVLQLLMLMLLSTQSGASIVFDLIFFFFFSLQTTVSYLHYSTDEQ